MTTDTSNSAATTQKFNGHNQLQLIADLYGAESDQTILFAHGGGQTRHAWRSSGVKLQALGIQSVCLDLRGHGDSAWCSDGDYKIETYAQDLIAVSNQLKNKPVLVGASLGGIAALVAAGHIDENAFSAIVLVDITPHMESSGVDKVMGFMGQNLEQGFASLQEAADVIASYLPHRPKPKNLDGLAKNLRLGDDGRYRWHWDPKFLAIDSRGSTTKDPDFLSDALVNIKVPMLLVRGKMSELVSENSVAEFLRLKPEAQYIDVADAGHMVAGDHNDLFTEAIVGFIKQLNT